MNTGTNISKNNEIILQGITKSELVDEISMRVMFQIEDIVKKASARDPLMDKKEAAAYLNVSLRKIEDLTTRGLIKYSKIDSSVRFRVSELDAFIAKNEVRIKR